MPPKLNKVTKGTKENKEHEYINLLYFFVIKKLRLRLSASALIVLNKKKNQLNRLLIFFLSRKHINYDDQN